MAVTKPMVYTCLAGIGGVVVIVAGAAICAFGVEKAPRDSFLQSNETVTIEDPPDKGLSLMALSGAVIIGFGSFVVIVSSVVFFEQRDQSIKDKINAEEKAKTKRGYKHKPKKKTPFEQVLQSFRRCIDDCSKPIKLKEIEKKEAEAAATDVITAQPTPTPRKTSQSESMTSIEKVLDNLPEFQTIDFLYRDDQGAGADTTSQDGDLLLEKKERSGEEDKQSFGSETSFTKMEDLMAKEEEDEEHESVSQAGCYSSDADDSVFTDGPVDHAGSESHPSHPGSTVDIGADTASEPKGDAEEREDNAAAKDTSSTTSKGSAEMHKEQDSYKDKEMTQDAEPAAQQNTAAAAASNNDTTLELKLHQTGVIMVREKNTADLPLTPSMNGGGLLTPGRGAVLTPGRLPPVQPRRLPLITDNVERLTCGIARTNAQAMDRARKPLPLPEILDSCP